MEEFIFSSSLVLLFNIIIVLIIIHYGNYIRKETIEQRKSFAFLELQLKREATQRVFRHHTGRSYQCRAKSGKQKQGTNCQADKSKEGTRILIC